MLPGQSHQIPSMGMPPGYAPMMQWEDPGGMPQQVIMMTAPTGQQIALTSVYPMPQNAMMPGQQRFMPPPPPYTVQMGSSFRTGIARNNEPLQLTEEQRKKMEKEAKQRQFMEQQRRLQGLSNLGSVKMDPDKLIESIIGKSETAHRAPTARPPAAPLTKGAQGFDAGEDVFGDFLSGSAASPAQGVPHHHSATAPPSNASSYVEPKQLGNEVLRENSTLSSAGEITSVKKTEGAPKEKKDLASMMMQCSDLTAPKEARRFEKRKTVNEVQVTKSVSVTYSESKAARHWDSSTEALSELFMLPASPASQPSAMFETFEGNATSPSVTSEFRLPPWITGEIPIHNLYQQVLEAVTRDGVILTELVYPLLLQSGLPRDALGYIWELCNRYTPGQLIREELFLILAMISIAQNGLDYSSLAILSKCPQSPVPNMGQLLGSSVPLQTAPFSGATLGDHATGNTTPTVGVSALPMTASFPNRVVDPTSYPPGTVQIAPAGLSAPDDNWRVPGQVQNLGHAVHEGSLPISSFSCQSPAASVSLVSQSAAADDDEFEQFQAAPLPLHGLSLSSVNSVAGPAGISPPLPNPHTSRGEFELMKMDDDKYAALRDLSSLSATESETDVAAANALEIQTTSAATDVTTPADTADLEFADFASFSDASASDIPASRVSTFSDNSVNLFQSHSAADVYFGARTQDVDDFSSFSSQMKSGAESARDFAVTVKSRVLESSGFATKPPGVLLNSQSASLSGNGLDVHAPLDARADARVEEDGEWASFSSSGEDRILSQTDPQGHLSTLVSGHARSLRGADVCPGGYNLSKGVDGWAEFESASNLDKGGMFGDNQRTPSSDNRTSFPGSSKQTAEVKHTNKTRHGNIAPDQVRSFFGQVNDSAVTPVGIGISPLDFHPPDLPDEDDDFDDFAVYPAYPRDGNSAGAISSLSMPYSEDERFESSSEEKHTQSAAVNGKTFTVLGMTQSNSSNSLEFTGWKLQSGAAIKEPDVHSTSSLELRQNKTSDFRDESPQQDGDSQSVSSLDFPPIESEQKSTTDEQSVASLELKPTSPVSDAHPSGDIQTSDKVPPTGDVRHLGFTFKDPGQGHPVDLKELLEQGSLGKFGDRYSELTNEVQDSDKHAYDWQRCLEICNGFLAEGSNTFSSLSSSSVLHEILSTEEGATYLKGLVEIYFVARRIEEEMRFVSVNNSKLASLVKEIDIEWSDLAAICAGSSIMPDLSSLSFQSSFLKADNVEARRKACGVCLLNVDVRNLDVSGDSGSRSLSYGGRQYHTACANFWINCVSKTLPSLTIPELL